MSGTSPEQIDALLAKQDIHEAMLRYFRGIDRRDGDLVGSAFHPDAQIEHGANRWTGTTIGPTIASRSSFKSTNHVMGNHLIELQGDTAFSETYMVCYLNGADERGDYSIVRMIRYIDQFERRNGAWKIAYRKTIRDWDRTDRITDRPQHAPYFEGAKGRDDLSYRRPLVDSVPVAR